LKTPVSIARDALDFRKLIRAGETVGCAEATAEPLLLTRLLDAQAERCPPFRVFFPLTFSDSLAAGHPNLTVTALGGAGAGRRFFAGGADNVVPAGQRSKVPGGSDRDERRARRMPPGAVGGGCPRPSPVPPRQAELRPDDDRRARRELGPRAASAEFGGVQLIMSFYRLKYLLNKKVIKVATTRCSRKS
jgi:hypothetical protein